MYVSRAIRDPQAHATSHRLTVDSGHCSFFAHESRPWDCYNRTIIRFSLSSHCTLLLYGKEAPSSAFRLDCYQSVRH